MRYCFDDASRTEERNVILNKNNTSENVASAKKYHSDERAPSFNFKIFLPGQSGSEGASGNVVMETNVLT